MIQKMGRITLCAPSFDCHEKEVDTYKINRVECMLGFFLIIGKQYHEKAIQNINYFGFADVEYYRGINDFRPRL